MDRATVWRFQNDGGVWRQMNDRCQFTGIRVSDLVAGVYVIALGREYLYVGQSGRDGLVRVRDGFLAPQSQTVHYAWRDQERLVGKILECWYFDTQPGSPAWDRVEDREALEADLAAALRFRSSRWPTTLTRVAVHGAHQRGMRFDVAVDFAVRLMYDRLDR